MSGTHRFWVLTMAALLLLVASCGGRASLEGQRSEPASQPDFSAALIPELPAREAQPPRPQPEIDPASLPEIDSLKAHGVSVTGPGYQQIDPQYYLDGVNMPVLPNGSISSNNLPPFSFAVFSLDHFPVDSFPTDLLVSTSTSEEYWVGFADFARRRWVFNGPFNASADVEIPFSGKPGGLHDYVSSDGAAFFLLLVEPANQVVFTGLRLGVDGGNSAPGPAQNPDGEGGPNGLLIDWFPSVSENDADFAGYLVERAPLFSGDFVALSSVPSRRRNYLDTTTTEGQNYRYRVVSLDTSGNRGLSNSTIEGAAIGGDTPPVLIFENSPGPYYGPAQIHFDLSGSFDPDGTPISSYDVVSIGGSGSTGLASSFDLSMQPGCYVVDISVTSNTKTTHEYHNFKVLPRWEDTSLTVAPALNGTESRLAFARMRYLEDGETLALIGYDVPNDALMVYTGTLDTGFTPHRLPSFFTPTAIEEPSIFAGKLLIPVQTVQAALPLLWSPEDGSYAGLTGVVSDATGQTRSSAVTDGNQAWLISAHNAAGVWSIVKSKLFGQTTVEEELLGGLGPVNSVAAAYNASTNSIDVVFSDGGSVQFLRHDLGTLTTSPAVPIAAATSACLDVEINPATGQPAVAWFQASRIRYREYDGASFSTEEIVDNTQNNFLPFDLRFANGTRYIYSSFGAGHSALYEYDNIAADWVERNTPPELANGAFACAIVPGKAENEILALDVDLTQNAHVVSMLPGNLSTIPYSFEAIQGNAFQLRSANGSDGLHLLCLDSANKPRHYIGNLNGSGWTEDTLPYNFATSVDIASQDQGEVYMSFNNANFSGSYRLDWWDPGTSSLVAQVPAQAGMPVHYPFLGSSLVSDRVGWVSYDSVTGNMTQVTVNQSNGVSTSTNPFGSTVLWRGASAIEEPHFFTGIFDGAGPEDGKFVSIDQETQGVNELYKPLFSGTFANLLADKQVDARVMDGCFYLATRPDLLIAPYVPTEAYVLCYGPFTSAELVEKDSLGSTLVETVDFPLDTGAFFNTELRRTVSACSGYGLTGVILISELGGAHSVLRWSNFGDWESLPLPPHMERMSRPELIVGTDGQWHIIYEDWVSGEIKCINSL